MSERYSDRGWSPEKHVIRTSFYADAHKYVNHWNFYTKKHITITGAGCDDRHLLDDYHLNPSELISIDKDSQTKNKVSGNIFEVLPRLVKKYGTTGFATINIDLTKTLPTYFDDFIKIAQLNITKASLMFVYNVNRTKSENLTRYQDSLNNYFGIPVKHIKYKSWTINKHGGLLKSIGSTMASVIYHL